MDGYALSSPHVESADEAPGVPCAECPRCGSLRLSPCPCIKAAHLSPTQQRVLALVGQQVVTSVGFGESSAAASLVRRGLLDRQGIEPVIYSLTKPGLALWRELRP